MLPHWRRDVTPSEARRREVTPSRRRDVAPSEARRRDVAPSEARRRDVTPREARGDRIRKTARLKFSNLDYRVTDNAPPSR
jgi:hypothetical protein